MSESGKVRVTLSSDGVWECRLSLGTDRVTGKRMRPYRRFPSARTEEEALEMAEEWASSVAPAYTGVSRNLSSMMAARIEQMRADGCKASTLSAYTTASRQIGRFVGSIPFDQVTTADVERAAAETARRGSRTGGRLSAASVGVAVAWLSSCYSEWVSMGIASTNPAAPVKYKPATGSYKKSSALSEEDFAALTSALAGMMEYDGDTDPQATDRVMATATYTALMTGMRVGEVAALRRRDLALETSPTATVAATVTRKPKVMRQPPKTDSSSREVPLTASLRDALAGFLEWSSASWLVAGARRQAVFCERSGALMNPDRLSRWFADLAKEIGLTPGTRFHTLRHTAATWMLRSGEDINAVKDILGHSDVRTTLEIYGHVLRGAKRSALDRYESTSDRVSGAGAQVRCASEKVDKSGTKRKTDGRSKSRA